MSARRAEFEDYLNQLRCTGDAAEREYLWVRHPDSVLLQFQPVRASSQSDTAAMSGGVMPDSDRNSSMVGSSLKSRYTRGIFGTWRSRSKTESLRSGKRKKNGKVE